MAGPVLMVIEVVITVVSVRVVGGSDDRVVGESEDNIVDICPDAPVSGSPDERSYT